MKLRSFPVLTGLLTIFIGTVGQVGCGDDDVNLPASATIRSGPYLVAPSAGTVTVSWVTDEPSQSRVEFGPVGGTMTEVSGITFQQEFTTDDPILAGELPTTWQHEVTLEGLIAGQEYSYRVLSTEEPFPGGVFLAPPDPGDDFAFVLFGDTRTNGDDHTAVITGIVDSLDNLGDAAFVLHTGDMVSSGVSEDQWTEFFAIEAPMLARVPLLPVFGNHEAILGRTIYEGYFKAPPSTTGDTDRWYSVDLGDIHFAVFDVHHDYQGEHQLEWLEQDLAASNAPFKFVSLHNPLYTFSNHLPEFDLRDEMLPILQATGVQLVVSGHNHLYERFFGQGMHFVVAGGGGAPLYGVDDNPDADNAGAVRRAADSSMHFVWAELTGTEIRFETIVVPDATPIDCWVIDSESPGAELPCN